MKKIFLGTLALGLITITACEKQSGCTDPQAINFDSAAEENDGSCNYEEGENNGFSAGETKTCEEVEFIWNDVTNPTTGKTWMDRNLGAKQVATSSTDANAYGDLYQWGRGSDGHQCKYSDTTSSLSDGDNPGHGEFILYPDLYTLDWRNSQNDNLWQGVDGVNNPCPSGYRIPTKTEWEEEVESWTSEDASGAYGSVLKLTMAGIRCNGSLFDVGTDGLYWSSTVRGSRANYLKFSSSRAFMPTNGRAYGLSIRCIKD